ncbi:hypothetical protein L0337_10840 [candidate division KSB1 bacterium]|nr:hypothetical protein [candidate division KSB1 bacterium]
MYRISRTGEKFIKLYEKPDITTVEIASPSLSPDGRFAAFVSKPTRGSNKVFLAATDGSGWIQLVHKGKCSQPVWKPKKF